MRQITVPLTLLIYVLIAGNSQAAFTISFDSGDFETTSVFNNVTSFNFNIEVDEALAAGTTYSNPTLRNVDYTVVGVLPMATPSGFPGFSLERTIPGTEFYNLSPEATISFSIAADANLNDGVQVDELSGTGTVFELNAREFDQDPGRFHPPIFSLDNDGTGRLVNANNQSTFDNPATNSPVDINIAAEYDVSLSFDTSLTVVAVPEPSSLMCTAIIFLGCTWRNRRNRLESTIEI